MHGEDETGAEITEEDGGQDAACRESWWERIEDHWFEIASAALLALATLMSAWCAFSSTEWHSDSAEQFNASSAAMVKASELFEKAHQEMIIDVISFTNFFNYNQAGDTEAAEAYRTRAFSPQLKKAHEAWIAADPLNNPDVAPTPFGLDEYKNPYRQLGFIEQARSKKLAAEAEDSANKGNQYLLNTVLFASVLFFAGISIKFKAVHLKVFLLILGFVMFIISTVGFILLA